MNDETVREFFRRMFFDIVSQTNIRFYENGLFSISREYFIPMKINPTFAYWRFYSFLQKMDIKKFDMKYLSSSRTLIIVIEVKK